MEIYYKNKIISGRNIITGIVLSPFKFAFWMIKIVLKFLKRIVLDIVKGVYSKIIAIIVFVIVVVFVVLFSDALNMGWLNNLPFIIK